MAVPTGWGAQIKLGHSGLKAYIYCRTSLKLKYASFHCIFVKGGHSETGWDLGPFAEVLAPEQTSPAIEYKKRDKGLKITVCMRSGAN